FVDQSDRTGYGMSMTWNGLKTDPARPVARSIKSWQVRSL
ncbi:carbohydrate porin, partial [Escherichia coli]|nr:carbohydrate porin [Escherichia coli]